MAIKSKVSSAWEEIDTLKVPVSGAYQEADHANALVSGAWQEVWGSGVVVELSTEGASGTTAGSNVRILKYTVGGSYIDVNFEVYGPSTNTCMLMIKVPIAIASGNTFTVTCDATITPHAYYNAEADFTYSAYDSNNTRIQSQTIAEIMDISSPVTISKTSKTMAGNVAYIKLNLYFGLYQGRNTNAGTIRISNLKIDGKKCKFV